MSGAAVKRPDGLNRKFEGVIGRRSTFGRAKLSAGCSQCAQHLRPIKSLPFAMVAKTHGSVLFIPPHSLWHRILTGLQRTMIHCMQQNAATVSISN